MKLIHDSKDSEYFAAKVENSGGVYFVPAFSGLGAPVWDMHTKGTVVGLTAGTGKNHLIRAALEAIAYQTEDVIQAMNKDISEIYGADGQISVLKVDGGASANSLLMQMQSDISGVCVRRSSNPEATAAGAAYLAGLAVGFYESREDIKRRFGEEGGIFTPKMNPEERKLKLDGWHRAVRACRAFSESEDQL
jgi:glycerol kinase